MSNPITSRLCSTHLYHRSRFIYSINQGLRQRRTNSLICFNVSTQPNAIYTNSFSISFHSSPLSLSFPPPWCNDHDLISLLVCREPTFREWKCNQFTLESKLVQQEFPFSSFPWQTSLSCLLDKKVYFISITFISSFPLFISSLRFLQPLTRKLFREIIISFKHNLCLAITVNINLHCDNFIPFSK